MDPDNSDPRLIEISTSWTAVCQAHVGSEETMRMARLQLLHRYEGAVRRYLGTALRDADAADDVFQEFALRFFRGDFHRASPEHGRFRDFLRAALRNLIVDYRTRQYAQPRSLGPNHPEPAVEESPADELEQEFLQGWRQELLNRTLERLEQIQKRTGQQWCTVVRLCAENPKLRNPELAEQLSRELGRAFTRVSARQLLHRAREKFTELLLEEVARSLANPTRENLEQELLDLNLLDDCREALQARSDPA